MGSRMMVYAGSVLIAVVFFAIGSLAGSMGGGSSGAKTASDQLVFISPPGCSNCTEMEAVAKSVASTLKIPFVKTGFSQQMSNPGYVLVYNNSFLGAMGFDTEYTLKNQVCILTKNTDVCNQAQKLSPPADNTQQQPAAANVPKTDKPTVELFVMAFCPYGVQAETTMKPVVDLLGGKADIKVKFIVNVGGTTPDSVQSLHGAAEAMEDLRQVCIRENYDYKKFWSYVAEIDANCYSIYRDAAKMETCWKAAAQKAGIDASAVESCINTTAVTLIKQDKATTDSYGVSSSPTLVINGQKANAARTPEGFKQAICGAFNTPPSECQTQLEGASTGQQPSGGCD